MEDYRFEIIESMIEKYLLKREREIIYKYFLEKIPMWKIGEDY